MEPIVDFSAAPHLPYSLRERAEKGVRPELALISLVSASQQPGTVVVEERNGEIWVAFGGAA